MLKALAVAGANRPITGGSGMASNGYGGDAASYHNGTASTHSAWGLRSPLWQWIDVLADGQNNGIARIEVNAPQTTGAARVVLSTMKDPDDTWANRNTTRPLGVDFNFSVFGPAGQYVGGGCNPTDSVDVLDFNLVGAGIYRVEVNREWARAEEAVELGVAFNWSL